MDTLKKRTTARVMRGRIFKISIACLVFLAFLVYNLFNLQYVGYAYYKNKVYDQITTSSALKAKRGNIYDSNMNLLATDKTVWRLFVSSTDVKRAERQSGVDYTDFISDGISGIIGVEKSVIYKKIKGSSVLDVTLKKTLSENEYLRVMDFIDKNGLESMVFTEAQTSRYYPEGSLAAHVLGFVGSDLQGLYGLEYSYDELLSGTDGYYLYAKDANGNALPTEYATYVEASDGYSIVTTIDSYLQSELESQVEAARLNHGATNRVTGIVMDTKTGAILAMATSSPFDPNSPYELDELSLTKLASSGYAEGSEEYKSYKKELLELAWSNKAISETYEPGSTFKIITVSAALDSKSANVGDRFSCHGYLTVGGWHIRCHKKGGHGAGFDLAYGLQMSCNPTMMTIAERMGADTFYEYVKSFGYLEKTGIDLPSEAGSIFHEKDALGTTELATASFGQRFKVSVIRQLVSICAVANGGKLLTPYVVSRVIDSDGNVITEKDVEVKRQVISESVASTVSDILEKGVSGGGGAQNAAVSGYKIAAKTGTSQKFDVLDENGNSYLRIGSTVGYSISDDGGIAVIIVVDEPQSQVKYGSVVAAPYVSAFLAKALPYLDYRSTEEIKYVTVGDYTGITISEAEGQIKSLGVSCEVIGGGERVVSQTPPPESKIYGEQAKIILYTEDGLSQYVIVPDLCGKSLSEANYEAINSGLNLHVLGMKDHSGSATVVSQSLPTGSVVPRESVIELEIIYYDFED